MVIFCQFLLGMHSILSAKAFGSDSWPGFQVSQIPVSLWIGIREACQLPQSLEYQIDYVLFISWIMWANSIQFSFSFYHSLSFILCSFFPDPLSSNQLQMHFQELHLLTQRLLFIFIMPPLPKVDLIPEFFFRCLLFSSKRNFRFSTGLCICTEDSSCILCKIFCSRCQWTCVIPNCGVSVELSLFCSSITSHPILFCMHE